MGGGLRGFVVICFLFVFFFVFFFWFFFVFLFFDFFGKNQLLII